MCTEKGSGTTTPPPPMRLVIVDDVDPGFIRDRIILFKTLKPVGSPGRSPEPGPETGSGAVCVDHRQLGNVGDAPVRVVVDVDPSRAAVAEPVAGERPDQAAHSGCPHLLAQCRPVYVQPVTVLHGNGLDGREEEGGRIVGVRPIG